MLRSAPEAEVGVGWRPRSIRNAQLLGRPGRWAVRLDGGRIAALGRETVSALRRGEVDARGRLVVPGFHDPHVHVLASARQRAVPRLSPDLRGLPELGRRLAASARAGGDWVHVAGFDPESMTGGFVPDRHFLDRVCGDVAVRLQARSLRLDVLSTPALRRCGLLAGPAPAGLEVVDGAPTGRAYQCGSRIRGPRRDLEREVSAWSDELLANGVTSIQDASESNGEEELGLLNRLADSGTLRQRARFMVSGEALRDGVLGDPALRRTAHAKLVAVESRLDPDALAACARAARRAGLGVAVHATNDAEIAGALHAIGAARRAVTFSSPAGPDRIEHANLAADATAAAIAAAEVAVVATPLLIESSGDTYLTAYAPVEHAFLHRLRSWRRLGSVLAIASDSPVTPAEPLRAVEVARRRKTAAGRVLNAAEALSRREAFAAVTLAPARLVSRQGELGQVAPGFLADLVVVADSRVELTLLGGEVVYA